MAAAAASADSPKPEPLRYLVVLDFKATCDEPEPADFVQEIIEFPMILYDIKHQREVSRFQQFVRPEKSTILTAFCTELTGITQDQVDAASPFLKVNANALGWLWENDLSSDDPSNFAVVTYGDWDLGKCYPSQLKHTIGRDTNVGVCTPKCFRQWINIKTAYQTRENHAGKGPKLSDALAHLEIEHTGRLHSGIDDCYNTLKICTRYIADGWTPAVTSAMV